MVLLSSTLLNVSNEQCFPKKPISAHPNSETMQNMVYNRFFLHIIINPDKVGLNMLKLANVWPRASRLLTKIRVQNKLLIYYYIFSE